MQDKTNLSALSISIKYCLLNNASIGRHCANESVVRLTSAKTRTHKNNKKVILVNSFINQNCMSY